MSFRGCEHPACSPGMWLNKAKTLLEQGLGERWAGHGFSWSHNMLSLCRVTSHPSLRPLVGCGRSGHSISAPAGGALDPGVGDTQMEAAFGGKRTGCPVSSPQPTPAVELLSMPGCCRHRGEVKKGLCTCCAAQGLQGASAGSVDVKSREPLQSEPGPRPGPEGSCWRTHHLLFLIL